MSCHQSHQNTFSRVLTDIKVSNTLQIYFFFLCTDLQLTFHLIYKFQIVISSLADVGVLVSAQCFPLLIHDAFAFCEV